MSVVYNMQVICHACSWFGGHITIPILSKDSNKSAIISRLKALSWSMIRTLNLFQIKNQIYQDIHVIHHSVSTRFTQR